jgi:anti-sigma B factor antagonist
MNGVPVLRPCGEVDIATATRLRPDWLALADTGQPVVVVDLREVTFMDVAGVSLLVALRNRQLAHGGRVHLRRVPAQVSLVLQLTGLAGILPVEPAPQPRPAADVIDLRLLESQQQLRD